MQKLKFASFVVVVVVVITTAKNSHGAPWNDEFLLAYHDGDWSGEDDFGWFGFPHHGGKKLEEMKKQANEAGDKGEKNMGAEEKKEDETGGKKEGEAAEEKNNAVEEKKGEVKEEGNDENKQGGGEEKTDNAENKNDIKKEEPKEIK